MYESNFSIYCFLLMNHISSKCNKNLEIITLLIHILSIFIILDCSFPLSCVLVEKPTSLFKNNSGYQRLQLHDISHNPYHYFVQFCSIYIWICISILILKGKYIIMEHIVNCWSLCALKTMLIWCSDMLIRWVTACAVNAYWMKIRNTRPLVFFSKIFYLK